MLKLELEYVFSKLSSVMEIIGSYGGHNGTYFSTQETNLPYVVIEVVSISTLSPATYIGACAY